MCFVPLRSTSAHAIVTLNSVYTISFILPKLLCKMAMFAHQMAMLPQQMVMLAQQMTMFTHQIAMLTKQIAMLPQQMVMLA